MPRATSLTALASVLLVSACSTGTAAPATLPPSPAPASSTTAVPTTDEPVPATVAVSSSAPPSVPTQWAPTPWTEALAAYDPEAPDVAAALTLFSLAFGPLPGVAAPPADSGAAGSLTAAYRAVLNVWDQLTPEQQAAVDAAVHPADADAATTPLGFAGGTRAKPDPALVAAINEAAVDMRELIAAKIGDFTGSLTIVVATRDNAAHDLAVTDPGIRLDGSFDGNCTITVLPTSTNGAADALLNTLVHELVHCHQLAAYGSIAGWAGAPGWVIEGGAEWAGTTVVGPDEQTPGRWANYLGSVTRGLHLRKYEAIGFWSHLAATGTDPWSVFRAVWATRGSDAAFDAAGANTPAFLETWASGFLREPERSAAWDATGPGISDDASAPVPLDVPGNGAAPATAQALSGGLYRISTSADVILVDPGTATVRVSDGTIDAVGAGRYCLRQGGCECPDHPAPVPITPLAAGAVLAVTGGHGGGTATVTGMPLDLHCKQEETSPVTVVFDRAADPSGGLLAGRTLELVSCDGPYGDWSGYVATGGLSAGGLTVDWQQFPLSFSFAAAEGTQTTTAQAGGVVTTPVFDMNVLWDFTITVDGETMTVQAVGSGDTDMFAVQAPVPAQALRIQPAGDACE